MENYKKMNPVAWFEIYVNDLARAKKFYEEVFQMEMFPLPNPTEDELEMVAFPYEMESENTSGALVKMEGFEAGSGATVIYFASEDCVTEESRVEAAGGKIFKNKMSIGEHGFITLFFDTEGNMIGLHSTK